MLLELLDGVPQFRQVLSALGRSFSAPVYAAGLTGAQRAMLAYGISRRKNSPVLLITPDEPTAAKCMRMYLSFAPASAAPFIPQRIFVSAAQRALQTITSSADSPCSDEF